MHEDTTPASVEDFRAFRRSAETIELPESGLTVKVRRAHIMELARQGVLPNHLPSVVLTALAMDSGKPQALDAREHARIDGELVDAVCAAVLLEPRMDLEPSEKGVLAPQDMPYADRVHIVRRTFLLAGVQDLERFPRRSAPGVAALGNGAGVPDPPQ